MVLLFYFIILVLLIASLYLWTTLKQIKAEKTKREWEEGQKFTTLRIDVPRNNEKAPLAAEQMFAAIHGIYSEDHPFQHHLSFEILARNKFIQFYVGIPVQLKDFVMGQIYAQYPTVEITEVASHLDEINSGSANFAICELIMTKPDVYPVKLFSDFEVDPLSGITSVMSNLNGNEEVWLQIIARPVGDEWQEKGNNIISAVRSGKKTGSQGLLALAWSGSKKFLQLVLMQALRPGTEPSDSTSGEIKLPGTVEEALKGIEYKIMKLGFETKLRVLSVAPDPVSARVRCQNVAAGFKQYNTTNLNGFKIGEVTVNDHEKWENFTRRKFGDGGNILNISELASIYHLPHQTVATPSIVWSGSKKGEPPSNLPTKENTPPDDLTVIGETNFRNVYTEFGVKRDDRRRHVYIIGKSGTGKSTLIENMATDDVVENRGVIVVDPHGDLADKVLSCIPDKRVEDVVVFDPADRAYPIAFNLLEHVDDDFKGMVASGFVGIFKKIFGESWGPRLEHILRNTVLALLDYPESTMLDIPKMLTDGRFRDKVVEKVKDPVIREFWVNEFAQYDSKFRTEAVSPILNKVGQFLATSTIRNIVGQPHSKINIREIMDQKKIMVVNLSRGKIGEDNSALLGAMIITKIQLAAMSRADVTIDQRPDCFLYVDEFQNFATDSFAVILSEARKYNLCLTMANQYVDQMPDEVKSAVFGNAGTIITFRVGGTDANFLVKEYEPVFDANDLVNLDKFNIYIKLLIDGISSPAFSARTLPPIQKLTGNVEKVVNLSRKTHSTIRATVEDQIAQRSNQEEAEIRAEAEAFKQGGLEALLVKKTLNVPIKSQEPAIKDGGLATAAKPAEISKPDPTTVPLTPAEKADEVPIVIPKEEEASLNGETKPAKKEKPRAFRYQNIIGGKVYKEQTARGGVKWYFGDDITEEKLKNGASLSDEAKKMIDLAKRISEPDFNNEPKKEKRAVETEKNQAGEVPVEESAGLHMNSADIVPVPEETGSDHNDSKDPATATAASASNLQEGEEVKL